MDQAPGKRAYDYALIGRAWYLSELQRAGGKGEFWCLLCRKMWHECQSYYGYSPDRWVGEDDSFWQENPVKSLKSKGGKSYDAYIIPMGMKEYHYTKDGKEKSGVQFKFEMEFPKKKK